VPWVLSLPPGVHLAHLLALAAALVGSAVATWIVRGVAPRLDFVSRPKGERWSTAPVPMGGGVAMFVAMAPGLWLLSPDLLLGATIVHLLGLIDDRRNLSPQVKLVFQTVAACVVVAAPLAHLLPPGASSGPAAASMALVPLGPPLLAIPATIVFYVFVANSTNLLDNMDGSAAGVSAVAAIFIYLVATGGASPDPALGLATAIVAGAALGFLLHNFPPARIFMGDAGSLLLGFVVAGLAVRLPRPADAGPAQALATTVFVVGAPLFDTGLVWVTRRNARRPFLQGGRDHTTHRLMALGLSPRRTLGVVYGVAAVLGGVSLAVARGGVGLAVAASVAAGVLCVLLGVFLGDVPVYRTAEGGLVPVQARNPAVLYAVELAVDVAALSACWLGAYALRFDGEDLAFYLQASALPALPFVIGAKVLMLLLFDLYRGFWRTIRFADVLAIAQAIVLGSVLVVVVATLTTRFENYSRGVFAIDALLSLLAVTGSRSALRAFRDVLERLMDHTRRAVIIGAAGVQELVAREAAALRFEVVGSVEPGAPGAVVERARELGAEVVLLAAPAGEQDPLVQALRLANLEVRRVRAVIE
jgi:UDP-GlcNAc:undecaprenyl-phosphate GlcNAc-1-phosphate transferase